MPFTILGDFSGAFKTHGIESAIAMVDSERFLVVDGMTGDLVVSFCADACIRAIAPCPNDLCVCIFDYSKALVVLRLKLSGSIATVEEIYRRQMARAVTRIRWTRDGSSIVVGDRFGDVFRYFPFDERGDDGGVEDVRPAGLLLGHISILMDFVLDGSEEFVYTAQRDQKIKRSYFEHPEVIRDYFLGHSEYVSSMDLILDEHFLVSAGGDDFMLISDTHADNNDRFRYKAHYRDFIPEEYNMYTRDVVKIVVVDSCALSGKTRMCILFEKCAYLFVVKIMFSSEKGKNDFVVELDQMISMDGWIGDAVFSSSGLFVSVMGCGSGDGKCKDVSVTRFSLCGEEFVEMHVGFCREVVETGGFVSCLEDVPDYLQRHCLRRGYEWSDKFERKRCAGVSGDEHVSE